MVNVKRKKQIDIENELLNKIKSLPEDYLCEVVDFVEYLNTKVNKDKTMYLSETSLAKDWLLKEEDEAWKDLKKVMSL